MRLQFQTRLFQEGVWCMCGFKLSWMYTSILALCEYDTIKLTFNLILTFNFIKDFEIHETSGNINYYFISRLELADICLSKEIRGRRAIFKNKYE